MMKRTFLRTPPPRLLKPATARSLHVVYFGSDAFSAHCLSSVVAATDVTSWELVCPSSTATASDMKRIETAVAAARLNIPTFRLPANTDWRMRAVSYPFSGQRSSSDVGVVVSFGYKLPHNILSHFRLGAINVHPSILPDLAGAAPIQHTIILGREHGGVTIQTVHEQRIDAGAILDQQRIAIAKDETYRSLNVKLANVAAELLVATLKRIAHSGAILPRTSLAAAVAPSNGYAKAPKLHRSDFALRWTSPAAEIERRFRGLNGYANVFTSLSAREVVIGDIRFSNAAVASADIAGAASFDRDTQRVDVVCGDGHSVSCDGFIVAGGNGRRLDAKTFVNGFMRGGRGHFDVTTALASDDAS